MQRAYRIFFCLLWIGATSAYARNYENLRDWPLRLSVSGNLQFVSTAADAVSGASFSRKFTNSYSGSASLGVRPLHHIYIGLRYEDWFSSQRYTIVNAVITNTLKWQTLGPEIGWYGGNPRVYWIISADVGYPLQLRIDSEATANTTYTTSAHPLAYAGRAIVGFKFYSWMALEFSTGYRYANLGHLNSGSTPFLATGGTLNFSGPFVGAGLALHF